MNKFERFLVSAVIFLFFIFTAIVITTLGLSYIPIKSVNPISLASKPTPKPIISKPPTNTPVPIVAPTLTAPPTVIPIFTSTPQTISLPMGDPHIAPYLDGILDAYHHFEDGNNMLASALKEASANPSVILRYSWKVDAALALTKLNTCGKIVRKLTPPLIFSEAHKDILAAVGHLDNAVAMLTDGLDNIDKEKISAGGDELMIATKLMHLGAGKVIALSTSKPTPTIEP